MRIIEQHRSEYRVHDGVAACTARIHPALLKQLGAADDGLAVGDWARFDDDGGWLVAALPRHNLLCRHREDGRLQRLVANVDTVFMVMGLDGDFSAEGLLPYRQMADAADVAAVAVLTKRDRAPDADAQVRAVTAAFGGGVPVVSVNARAPDTVSLLAPWLGIGQTVALFGSSGVGKSTLTNTLMGTEVQRTGATQALDDLGRHTTTARSLRLLPGGACLVDTPGLRAVHRMPTVPQREDFADLVALADGCRFANCSHGNEPGCAVRAGAASERIDRWLATPAPAADVASKSRSGRRRR